MGEVSIIGIDLAKRSFQLHGARADGSVAFRKTLRRGKVLTFLASQPRCVVAMEACASAHYWGREIVKLGHRARLIPPLYVKPFVKRQKNDATDAEAICEAALRPCMRFVAVKGEEQQARAMLFRVRDLLVRQRTQAINALRGHLVRHRRGKAGPMSPAWRWPSTRRRRLFRRRCPIWPRFCLGRSRRSMRRSPGWTRRSTSRRGGTRKRSRGWGRSARWRSRPSRRRWRASDLRLARAGAAPALDRRQAPARHIEDGPARPQAAAGLRRHAPWAIRRGEIDGPGALRGGLAIAWALRQAGLPGSRRRLSGRERPEAVGMRAGRG